MQSNHTKATRFSFESGNDNLGITPVENAFINLYMPQAHGDYVKVYLYGLKLCFGQSAIPVDDSSLSQELHMTEGDVRKAWAYWQEQGILSVTYGADGQADVQFFNIPALILNGPKPRPAKKQAVKGAVPKGQLSMADWPADPAPKNPDEARIADMYAKVQAMLGSEPLSRSGTMTLSTYVKDYHFDPEAVVVLAEYTLTIIAGKDTPFSQKQMFHYMDAVADNWHRAGVITFEDAERVKRESSDRQKRYYDVLKYLGIHRGPMQWEKKMIDKWFDDYGNGIELVQAAMDRTNTPNLKYIDGILKRWHEQQITTLEAVEAEAAAHHHKRRQPVPMAPEEAADTKRREALMDEITEHDIENLRRLYNDNQNDTKPAH